MLDVKLWSISLSARSSIAVSNSAEVNAIALYSLRHFQLFQVAFNNNDIFTKAVIESFKTLVLYDLLPVAEKLVGEAEHQKAAETWFNIYRENYKVQLA